MREPGFRLTPSGRCQVPTCGATVYAELRDTAQAGRFCADCAESPVDELHRRMFGVSPSHCTEACCRKKAA
jgi:hypothetical protein